MRIVSRTGQTQWDIVAACEPPAAEAVEVLVLRDDERPMHDVEIVLYSPSTGHHRDVTDARGRCRFEGIPVGETTRVSIAELDCDAWELVTTRRMAASRAASSVGPSPSIDAPVARPPTTHVVAPGECLYRIAHAHGFLPTTLWDRNASKWGPHDRKGSLPLGLELDVPARRVGVADVPAGHLAVLHRIGLPVVMTLRIVDADGEVWAGSPYVLSLRASSGPVPTQAGITDSEGRLHVPVMPDVTHAQLRIELDGPGRQWTVDLRIGDLRPADTPEGAKARLWNLGYRGGANLLWREADVLADFQRHVLDEEPGALDEATARALTDLHQS